MASELIAGVIGCGRMGAFTSATVRNHAPRFWLPLSHAEAIMAEPRLRLAALCDTDPGALGRAADAYGLRRTFSDPHLLLEEMRPALISVATRTPGRAAIIEAAISAGTTALHVEKPLCNSMRELDRLAALFARDSIHVTYGAIRRLLYPYRAARDFVASGALGELLEIQVNMGCARLYWTHPHSVDAILFAAAGRRLESVSARLGNVETGDSLREILTDPWIESASFLFADGLEGRITRAPGSDVVFSCERGTLAVEADGRETWLYETRGDDPYPRRFAWSPPETASPGGTLAAMAALVNCLEGETAAVTSNAEIKRDMILGQRLLFTMAQSSAESGRAVHPGAVDPEWIIRARSGSAYA